MRLRSSRTLALVLATSMELNLFIKQGTRKLVTPTDVTHAGLQLPPVGPIRAPDSARGEDQKWKFESYIPVQVVLWWPGAELRGGSSRWGGVIWPKAFTLPHYSISSHPCWLIYSIVFGFWPGICSWGYIWHLKMNLSINPVPDLRTVGTSWYTVAQFLSILALMKISCSLTQGCYKVTETI